MRRTYRKNKIKETIIRHIENNFKTYLVLIIVFFIGLILGIMFINNAQNDSQKEIDSYIHNFIEQINGNYQISKFDIFIKALKNNLITSILLWVLGCIVFGVPLIYLVIGYKGFCIGFSISAIIASLGTGKGILFAIATMLMQNIIYIPIYLAMAVSGINLQKNIAKERKKEEMKINLLKHSITSLGMFGLLAIGSIFESYISGTVIENISKFF